MSELAVRRTRLLLAALLLLAVFLTVAVLPVPSPLQMRTWARAVGIAAPLLFLFGHAVVTTAPVLRTAFTLAAGLLFGTGRCGRWTPVGVVSGSVTVVVLGDALTGTTSPALLTVSLTGAAIGVVGLIAEARSPASATQREVTLR